MTMDMPGWFASILLMLIVGLLGRLVLQFDSLVKEFRDLKEQFIRAEENRKDHEKRIDELEMELKEINHTLNHYQLRRNPDKL